MGISAHKHQGRPLDPEIQRRINYLWHELKVRPQKLIAKRLNVTQPTVSRHLLSKEKWEAAKRCEKFPPEQQVD